MRDYLLVWAKMLADLREFFAERNLLEVQTDLARDYVVSDPYQRCFQVVDQGSESIGPTQFLQPSPESAMKQLLAAGSGSIYQICKAFRAGERGRSHLPEFTMLEWYRVGYDHWQLMDEVAELVNRQLGKRRVEKITWREAFIRHVGLDPITAGLSQLQARLAEAGIAEVSVSGEADQRRTLLDLLLVTQVEPQLGSGCMTFVYDYPSDQAALARIREDSWPVAERFELYLDGIEIANGFHELNDADQQRKRFERDNLQRQTAGLAAIPLDEPLLLCLDKLPDCAGVAMGVDRLIKIQTGAGSLDNKWVT